MKVSLTECLGLKMENFSDLTHWELSYQSGDFLRNERYEFPADKSNERYIAPRAEMNYEIEGIACPSISLNSKTGNRITQLADNTPITVGLYRDQQKIVMYKGVVIQFDVSAFQFNMRVHQYEYRRADKYDLEIVSIDFRRNQIFRHIDIDFNAKGNDKEGLPF